MDQGTTPMFDTRAEAEAYAEDLAMQGYERSFGWDVRIEHDRNEDGERSYAVRMSRCRPDA